MAFKAVRNRENVCGDVCVSVCACMCACNCVYVLGRGWQAMVVAQVCTVWLVLQFADSAKHLGLPLHQCSSLAQHLSVINKVQGGERVGSIELVMGEFMSR